MRNSDDKIGTAASNHGPSSNHHRSWSPILQVILNKLDEESRAHFKSVVSTGKHAANVMSKLGKILPLGLDETMTEADQSSERSAQAPSSPFSADAAQNHQGHAQQQPLGPDPSQSMQSDDAADIASEAITQNAEAASAEAFDSIPDILKGGANAKHKSFSPRPSSVFQDVTQEALQGHKTVAAGAGTPAFLRRAFSLCERDDAAVDLEHLTTLQKVS